MAMSPRVAPELHADKPPTLAVGGVRAWLLVTAVATVLGLAVGYRLGLQAVGSGGPPDTNAAIGTSAALPQSATPAASNSSSTTRLATARFAGDPVAAMSTGEVSFEHLVAQMRDDAALRADLWTRYRSESDPLRRESLLAVLAQAPPEALADFVATLVADSDPTRRTDGYRLLTNLPIEDPALREHALRALQHEADSIALTQLVQGLQPGLLPTEDAEPLARALESLAQSGDPGVRAAALPGLSQWTERAQLDSIYLAALGDGDARVRAAAIAGIDASGVSTPELRGSLLRLAANPAENAQARHSALLALSRFRLTRAEVELYRMLQVEVPVDPGHG